MMKSWAAAALAAATIAASGAPSRPSAMLAPIVSSNSVTSCATIEMASRSEVSVTSRRSWPSMVMRPSVTSNRRGTRFKTVDLPAPERPTSATVFPPGTSSEKLVMAGIPFCSS